MKNDTLFKIAEGQKSKLDTNMQDAFERIVLAGMDFLYKNDKTSAIAMQEIDQAQDKPTAVGEGVAAIMLILSQKSRGKMPWEAGVMAGYALVCEALDFLEQKGVLQVDNAAIDTAMMAYGQKLMNLLKIDNGQVDKMMSQAQQMQGDPKMQDAYKAKYGQEMQA